MVREREWGGKKRANPNEIIGFGEMETLDDLLRVKVEMLGEEQVLTHEVSRMLHKEFLSETMRSVLQSVRITKEDFADLKNLTTVLHNIPDKLYFFLWSLKNCDVMPVEGVITSFQLQKSIFYLCKFLLVLEVFLKRAPRSIPVYESLAFVYLDLAGLAKYSPSGLMLQGRLYRESGLLRKAIACFQIALRMEAHHGKELDSVHRNTLRLLDKGFDFRQSRVTLYLNPWYFMYISSALQQLNDEEGAEAYLKRARTILNSIPSHLNPRVRAQHDLLEAVYTIMKEGDHIKFDFEDNDLSILEKKLKRVQKEKRNGNNHRSGYNPMVEEALTAQYQQQAHFREKHIPDAEQLYFLRSVFALYQKVTSSVERDKLIYRLNIPPLKIKGLPRAVKGVLAGRQRRSHTLQAASA